MSEYTLIRAHKRTLSLQITPQGQLVARAPYLMPKFLIDRFIKQKSTWINKKLNEIKKPITPPPEYFTIDKLKTYIENEVAKYAQLMEVKPLKLRYTQVKSYWGTCSSRGVISFNLALRYVPKKAVSYVVVHELAHLRWNGHNRRFWAMVTKYYPDTKDMRAHLRKIPRHGF